MLYKKFRSEIFKISENFKKFFNFKFENEDFYVVFKSGRFLINYIKFHLLGTNKTFIINKNSNCLIQKTFSLPDLSDVKIIPFEIDLSKKLLHCFLFLSCNSENCNCVAFICDKRKVHLTCIEHCNIKENCIRFTEDCKHKNNLSEFNNILDNYIKLAIDKIYGLTSSFESFQTNISFINFKKILHSFFNNIKENPRDPIYQKIRICSMIGVLFIRINTSQGFYVAFDNHPLRNCLFSKKTKKIRNYLQIINPLFSTIDRKNFLKISRDNKQRLYYKQQLFPQEYLIKEDYGGFFNLINSSEELFKFNPDLFPSSIAKTISSRIIERNILTNDNKHFAILDLGCGEGNLITNVLSLLTSTFPDVKFNIQLVEIDENKLIAAVEKINNQFKHKLLVEIDDIPKSIFEDLQLNNADVAIISQVFDLYIDFLPNSNERIRKNILNRNLYYFFHSLIFFKDNAEGMDLFLNFERTFVSEYQGAINYILNKVKNFCNHIFIFDHFFRKDLLLSIWNNQDFTIEEVENEVLKSLKFRGIKFLHIE